VAAMLTKDEYENRYQENQALSGFGLEVKTHLPCPFCAAPEFLVYPIWPPDEHQKALEKGADCKECGRGMRVVYTANTQSMLAFKMVQTKGDDPPDYILIGREERAEAVRPPPPLDLDLEPESKPKGEVVRIEKDE
jgi:hypothetical protein